MGRHAPLTDDQRAAIADRAVELVAATLAETQDCPREATAARFQRRE